MEATGPVTVVSKTQVATGDRGSYDKEQNKVWLFGNVTLSDSGNVTKGDRLTYDMTTGEAVVEVDKSSGRVHGQFIPGSNSPAADSTDKSAPKKDAAAGAADKPKAAKKKVPPDESASKP
jgi:lipopolysaccharide export system protein LptA